MSHERSAPAGTPPGASSSPKRRRSHKLDLSKVKVFDKPEFQVPFHLHKKRGSGELSLLELMVESGLADTASPSEALDGAGLLRPYDGGKLPRMERADLMRLVAEGMANTLRQMQELEEKRKAEEAAKENR